MNAISNIWGVAQYERKMLLRTTRFRILGGLGMLIPVLLGIVLAIADARGFEFEYTGLGAYMPCYVYSLLQTIVIAFIAGDFRAADERAHIDEVVAARPISTAELVLGKYLGVIGALFTLSLGVLILTLAIQAAKISVTGAPFSMKPYLGYLLLMNLPGLIYMSALTFFLGALLRRQTAVALIVITYALSVLFFLGRRYDGVFDFGAFFAPLYFSDLIGLGDINRVIALRLFYLALALGFLGLSIDRYPRLSQSMAWRWFGRSVAIAGLFGAVGIYTYLEVQTQMRTTYRTQVLAIQNTYADRRVPEVVHYDLDIDLTGHAPLSGQVALRLKNTTETALDTLILSLNPGLAISALRYGDENQTRWARKASVILIYPQIPLVPDAESIVALAYEGHIDSDGFDLLRDEGRLRKREGPITKGSMTAWIRKDSAFLPPRSRWYPVAGVDYGHADERMESFATAAVTVKVRQGLEVITQGQITGRDTVDTRVVFSWEVAKPTPFFSLNVGKYDVFETQINGIDCALYIHPSHRAQVAFFEDAENEVIRALDQMMDAMTQESGLSYPYPRLSVVEAPFHVQWYYEGWEETGGLTQPGVLMVEEDMLLRQRFRHNFNRISSRAQGNREPKDIKKDQFVQAIFALFFSSDDARGGLFRSPVVQLWAFDKNFGGEHYGLMKTGLPLHLQSDLSASMRTAFYARGAGGRMGMAGGFARPTGSSAAWDTLVTQMQQRSLSDLDPDEEARLYRSALQAKGASLFKMVDAYLGKNEFMEMLKTIGEDYRYDQVDFASFEQAAVGDPSQDKTRQNLQRLMRDWIYGTEVPGYSLTRAVAHKVDDGFGMVLYQLVVRIRNGEPGRGFVQIRAMGRGDEAVKGVEIEGGQEVEVSMVLWERPMRVVVEPFFARNRRALVSPVRVPEEVREGFPETYVKEVAETDVGYVEIVVDNDDEGFSMPIRRVRRYLRPELQGGNWEERTAPMAFGRYESNFRHKAPGDGAQPAVWATRLPRSGTYDVAYYFVDPNMARRFGLASRFSLIVFHSGGSDTLSLERDTLRAGWNVLGHYHVEADHVSMVELPDLGDGRLYADAVRWRYIDPDLPDSAYEEDMPAWGMQRQWGGRAPGGGPMSGRGGRGF